MKVIHESALRSLKRRIETEKEIAQRGTCRITWLGLGLALALALGFHATFFQKTSLTEISNNIWIKKIKKGEKRAKNVNINIEYFKLPFIGDFSTTTKKKVANLYKRFCKEGSEFRLVFNTTKVRDYFSTKDSLPSFPITCRLFI